MDNRQSGKITKKEIRDILNKHYNVTHGGAILDRELIVMSPDKNKDAECYFFALQGTPPKGYGIYIPENRNLLLYDANGKRFKNYYLDEGITDL